MKDILIACEKMRPITICLCSFMAGIFYNEELYWWFGTLSFIVAINIPYLYLNKKL